MTTYLVSYDIEDNRVRNRLAKYLEKCGLRLQKSVFAVRLERFRLKSFTRRLEQIVGAAGKVALFRLCPGCRDSAIQIGPQEPQYYMI